MQHVPVRWAMARFRNSQAKGNAFEIFPLLS